MDNNTQKPTNKISDETVPEISRLLEEYIDSYNTVEHLLDETSKELAKTRILRVKGELGDI